MNRVTFRVRTWCKNLTTHRKQAVLMTSVSWQHNINQARLITIWTSRTKAQVSQLFRVRIRIRRQSTLSVMRDDANRLMLIIPNLASTALNYLEPASPNVIQVMPHHQIVIESHKGDTPSYSIVRIRYSTMDRTQFAWATIENNVYCAKLRSTSLSDTMRETFVYSKCSSEKKYIIIKRICALGIPTIVRVHCCAWQIESMLQCSHYCTNTCSVC